MKTGFCLYRRLALKAAVFAASGLMISCANRPVAVDLVGPPLNSPYAMVGGGNLIVYSATEEKRLDKGLPYYLHTGYLIKTSEGKTFKWVPNHTGDMDESAQLVSLPAGHYVVVASSEEYGRLNVPVVIGAFRTTEIHLEGKWKPDGKPAQGVDFVRLPNGRVIGWKGNSGKSGPG